VLLRQFSRSLHSQECSFLASKSQLQCHHTAPPLPQKCLRGLPAPLRGHRSSCRSRIRRWTRLLPRPPTRRSALAAATSTSTSNYDGLFAFPPMILFAVYQQGLVASQYTLQTSMLRGSPSPSAEEPSYQYIVRLPEWRDLDGPKLKISSPKDWIAD
jgi:hypothetical protein